MDKGRQMRWRETHGWLWEVEATNPSRSLLPSRQMTKLSGPTKASACRMEGPTPLSPCLEII